MSNCGCDDDDDQGGGVVGPAPRPAPRLAARAPGDRRSPNVDTGTLISRAALAGIGVPAARATVAVAPRAIGDAGGIDYGDMYEGLAPETKARLLAEDRAALDRQAAQQAAQLPYMHFGFTDGSTIAPPVAHSVPTNDAASYDAFVLGPRRPAAAPPAAEADAWSGDMVYDGSGYDELGREATPPAARPGAPGAATPTNTGVSATTAGLVLGAVALGALLLRR